MFGGSDTLGRENKDIRKDLERWLGVRRDAEKEGLDAAIVWHFAT